MNKLSNASPGKTGSFFAILGGPSGTRTRDLRIKRPPFGTHETPVFTGNGHASESPWSTGEPSFPRHGTKADDSRVALAWIGGTVLAASLLAVST